MPAAMSKSGWTRTQVNRVKEDRLGFCALQAAATVFADAKTARPSGRRADGAQAKVADATAGA